MSEEQKALSERFKKDFSGVIEDTIADIPHTQESVVSEPERQYEISRREQILREKEDEIRRLNEVHGMRKKYLIALFAYLCAWSLVTVVIVFAAAFFAAFRVSDAVLITLLTTTLAQVLGLTAIAFKWLFPKK